MKEIPDQPKKRVRPPFLNNRLILTLILAVIYGLITRLIFGSNFTSGFLSTMSFSFLCLTPVAIGAITAFLVARRRRLGVDAASWGDALVTPTITATIFLVFTAVINIENSICIIMAAPLFLVAALLGSLIMNAVLRYARRHPSVEHTPSSLLAALLIAPYLLSPLEVNTPTPDMIREVHNSIDIAASPDAIWAQIVSVPSIQPHERQTRLSHLVGIPQPLEATLSHDGVGGMRHARYVNGLAFEEYVTVWEPNQRYRFTLDLDEDAPIPAPFDQFGVAFEIYEATYRLEALSDGRTRLHLSSTYRLSTRINAYGGLWTDYLLWDLQQYLLEIIQGRCERTTIGS